MSGWQIVGPHRPHRPSARHEQPTQPRAHIETRANTGACPSCGSGLWDNEVGYCPGCGHERTNNGHPIQLDQRADMPCGVCGGPFKLCLHGYQAQGSC
jgi:hypothetical protein